MTSYIIGILAVVILGIIADLMLSGKRMGKFVRGVFAALTILIIIAPLPGLIKGGTWGEVDLFGSAAIDEEYLSYASQLKAKALQNGVESALSESGYRGTEVKIDVEFGTEAVIKRVKVNLSKMVMDGNVSHINKYEAVEKLTCEYLGVDKEVIEIYE